MIKPKVVFGIPTEGHTPPESFQTIRQMCFRHGFLEAQGRFEFYDSTAGRMFTPMAREKIADTALAIDADYLFMIDDDMLAPKDLFERLQARNVDVIAPLAFTRNAPYLPVMYQTTKGWDPIMKQEYVINDWVRNWPRQKLVECDAVGFGAVLIKVSVLKKMKRPFFMCSSGTGEDIWFCHRAKEEAGARIFMDTTVELGHISSPIIVDTALHEAHNNPETLQKLYAPYKRFGVFEVSHEDPISQEQLKQPEVLAR